MPSTSSHAARAASALLLLAATTNAHSHDHSPLARSASTLRARAGLSQMTYVGCFSSSAGLEDQGSYQYQTSGYCQPICVNKNNAVLGLSEGSNCWCGDAVPSASSKVDDSKCNTPCNGYGQQNCGGSGFWSVYLDGLSANVPNADGSSSSSSPSSVASSAATTTPSSSDPAVSSPATTVSPSVVTSIAPGSTVIITQQQAQQTTDAANKPSESGGHKSNTAGIAAGVVVGVVGVAAIIGGVFFFLKRRRQRSAEDEYKRSNQVGDFMRGGNEIKPPPTAYSQMSDSRLDPMAGKRNSSGSIADAEDYSRRILRVANPDGN